MKATTSRSQPKRWTAALAGAEAPARRPLQILQLNIGRYCNIKCVHCHVNAGPERSAQAHNMTPEVRARVLEWIDTHRPSMVDLTGGAPELIDGFREIVRFCRERDVAVMDRCNLVCLHEPGQEDLASFLAEHQVEVIASLPCYSRDNVDKQRGDGVFMGSIEGLRKLNAAGYGAEGGPTLNLIYNPVGASLPPEQQSLEADYKLRLAEDFGITFNSLYCLTNMPISRFAVQLYKAGEWDSYWQLLLDNYSPGNLDSLMCRDTLSVGHDGVVADCDFNLVLRLPLADETQHRYLWDLEPVDWSAGTPIAFRDHCLGCTAGAGSSCGGQLSG